MCATSLSRKQPYFPGMRPAPGTPPMSAAARPLQCVFGEISRGCLYSHGLYNLQGPKLFTGTPSLFRIVESVLRSDLESVLTGNQQFLR